MATMLDDTNFNMLEPGGAISDSGGGGEGWSMRITGVRSIRIGSYGVLCGTSDTFTVSFDAKTGALILEEAKCAR
jgi:hypothetical protein